MLSHTFKYISQIDDVSKKLISHKLKECNYTTKERIYVLGGYNNSKLWLQSHYFGVSTYRPDLTDQSLVVQFFALH